MFDGDRHAFGVTRDDGVELLVHIGIHAVEANGDGFTLGKFKQGDKVKAGGMIVEVDLKKVGAKYNTSTILIVTNANGKGLYFSSACSQRTVCHSEINRQNDAKKS